MSDLPRRPRPSSGFRPSNTLLLLYFAAIFLFFAFALIVPALWPLLESPVTGPELQALAEETARTAVRPRLGLALGLAVVATGVGAWLRILPGLRRDGI